MENETLKQQSMAETNPLEIIRQQKQNCDTALEAARTEKECLEETKKAIFEAAKEHAQAYIPEEEEKRFLSKIKQTSCAAPTSAQMIPVLKESLKEVGPEITYKRVINGKKWFWVGVCLFAMTACFWVSYYKKVHNFDGTAESWANRMYVASKEIGEKNPGDGYDEVMTAFANGNAENAKNLVVRKENKLAELQDHRGKYEKAISEFLSKDYPSGIRIVELQETTEQRYEAGIWGQQTTKTYNFVYAKAVTFDEQEELHIAMERPAMPFWARDPWDIYITTDTRINSVQDYRQKAKKVNWNYAKKKAIQ